jgi:DNA-directed RNA polymerase subunit RPC12/RpoP
MSIINLSTPIRSERVRDFQPPWRTVFVYKCSKCNKETRVRASSFRGKTPVPSTGAIRCPHCPEPLSHDNAAEAMYS